VQPVIQVREHDWRVMHRATGRASSAIARILMKLLDKGLLLEDRDVEVKGVLPVLLDLFPRAHYVSNVNAALRMGRSALRVSEVATYRQDQTNVIVAPSVGLGSLCE
jgi:hypothetical protein